MATFSLINTSSFFVFFLVINALQQYSVHCAGQQKRRQQAPALFVFGDSIVDSGNNAFVEPDVNTKHLPYGIDFPTGPTGRFTNGRNPSDLLGQYLGLPHFVPAAKDPKSKGEKILYGVNYASGGSGILDSDTNKTSPIQMNQQLQHFEAITLPDLRAQLNNNNNNNKLSAFLAKSIFVFHTGGNDLGCGRPNGNKTQQTKCTLSSGFYQLLMSNFTLQLKKVHGLGARKFVIFGVQTIGCNPFGLKSVNGKLACNEERNHLALSFNALLRSSIDKLKHDMPGSNIVYVNTFKLIKDALDNPIPKGFKVVNATCCITSMVGCVRGSEPCKNRNEYMYFDGGHFTEALYKYLVQKVYLSQLADEVYPFNVRHLVSLR